MVSWVALDSSISPPMSNPSFMRPTRLTALLVALLLLAACSGAKDTATPPTPLERIEGVSAMARPAWQRSTGESGTHLRPLVTGSAIYVIAADGELSAFEPVEGAKLWSRDTDLEVAAGVGGDQRLLLLAGEEAELIALAAADGSERWRQPLSSVALAPSRRLGDLILTRVGDGSLVAHSGEGEQRWRFTQQVPPLSLFGTGAPVVPDALEASPARSTPELILAGFDNGKLAALEPNDGALRWLYTIAQSRGRSELERMVDLDGDPLVLWEEGTVYAASFQGRLVGLDLLRGKGFWATDLSSNKALAYHGDTLFASDEESNVWAFDRRSGNSLWRQDKLIGRRLTAPVLFRDAIVVGDLEGYLHWLALDDGRLLDRHRLDDTPIEADPIRLNDTLYVMSRGGRLAAYR